MEARSEAAVLVVEDDPSLGPLVARMLGSGGYDAALAASHDEALELGAKREFAMAICDINLPGGSGLELIGTLRERQPDLAIVIATGVSDTEVADVATRRGAYGYLIKPFDKTQLLVTANNAMHRRGLEIRQREHEQMLERTVEARTRELRSAIAELTESREETIKRLMQATELRDDATGEHIERVGHLSELLARWAGLPEERAALLRLAAPMHDVGKIGVPDRILLKPGPLDPEEREEIKRHAVIGGELLSGSTQELLRLAAKIAATHHEWYDGTGYPGRLAGEEIPIEGRIVAIVDVFDALHSDRCYRPALDPDEALQIMRDGRGNHFDPELLDTFLSHREEVLEMIGISSPA